MWLRAQAVRVTKAVGDVGTVGSKRNYARHQSCFRPIRPFRPHCGLNVHVLTSEIIDRFMGTSKPEISPAGQIRAARSTNWACCSAYGSIYFKERWKQTAHHFRGPSHPHHTRLPFLGLHQSIKMGRPAQRQFSICAAIPPAPKSMCELCAKRLTGILSCFLDALSTAPTRRPTAGTCLRLPRHHH